MSVVLRVDSKMDYTFYVDYVDFFSVKCSIYNKEEEIFMSNYQIVKFRENNIEIDVNVSPS